MLNFNLRHRVTRPLQGLIWNLKRPKGRLPDFLIIGGLKCGTSTLAQYLKAHPEINLIAKESDEFHFFDSDRYYYGKNYYQSHFTEVNKIQGEKTPKYIFDKSCHAKMAKIVPNAKLILMLRDPVKRAYSHWNHFNFDPKKSHWGRFDFETALIEKPHILTRGHYMEQIDHLLKFYPREQLHIIIFEEFIKNSSYYCNQLFEFLKVRPFVNNHCYKVNSHNYQTTITKTLEKKLSDYYAPYNRALFDFLGHTIEEWN
ncbi:MAG: sulfotransferase [Bacteriovoracaceae bacterium]